MLFFKRLKKTWFQVKWLLSLDYGFLTVAHYFSIKFTYNIHLHVCICKVACTSVKHVRKIYAAFLSQERRNLHFNAEEYFIPYDLYGYILFLVPFIRKW